MNQENQKHQKPKKYQEKLPERNVPITQELEAPLCRRLVQLREMRNLTRRDLAKRTNFTEERIVDLETGLETWLSAADRQMLARALAVDPPVLQEVEDRPRLEPTNDPKSYQTVLNEITVAILGGMRELACPQCGHTMRCRVQEGLDIDEQPIYFAKAFCEKCPFTLK